MTPHKQDEDNTTLEQQQARATLRESFLKAIVELNGQPCNVLTYEKTSLNATFMGWNPDNHDILVRNLETPSGVKIDSALLRSPDILSIQFDKPVQLP